MAEPATPECHEEDEAIQRTTHVIAAVTGRLRTLGLTGIEAGAGKSTSIGLQERRELLIFLSELEELVERMQGFADNLADGIVHCDRGHQAITAYRNTGAAYRHYHQRRGH